MDHEDVLALPLDDFVSYVRELEAAFATGHASFSFDLRRNVHGIEVFDVDPYVENDFAKLAGVVQGLDHLMTYAFGGAPDDVIHSWGEGHGQGLGAKAVKFVPILREQMPTAQEQWRFRASGIGRTLGGPSVSVVYSTEADDFVALLRADSFYTTGARLTPLSSSRQTFDVALSRADLRRLIYHLQRAEELFPMASGRSRG